MAGQPSGKMKDVKLKASLLRQRVSQGGGGGGEGRGVVKDGHGKGRLYMRHSGDVYDLTDFAERHPGGKGILTKHAGEDITRVMQQTTPHRHSPAAYSILTKYRVHITDSGDHIGDGDGDGISFEQDSGSRGDSGFCNAMFFNVEDDDLVDWNKSILKQIPALGERYHEWVFQPVDHEVRLFESDLLERLSKNPWYCVPAFWVPVTILFLCRSYAGLSAAGGADVSGDFAPVVWRLGVSDVTVGVGCLPLLVLVGVLLWTLCEYSLHRWLFHLRPPTSLPTLVLFHFILHGQHHKAPMDKGRLVFPILPACVLGSLMLGMYSLASPWPVAQGMFAGTVLGYVCYDLTHYYLHHGSPSQGYLARLKRYHVNHHFVHQHLGFGISSKLWDYPFGTLIPDRD